MENSVTILEAGSKIQSGDAFAKKLLITQLKTIFWTEKQLLPLFAKLEKAATTVYLKACFKGHLVATKQQVKRLRLIFKLLNEKVVSRSNSNVKCLLAEAESAIRNTQKETLCRDISVISIAQKIEAWEIEKYNDLIHLAVVLGEFRITEIIEESLSEEKEAQEVFMAIREDTLKDELFKIEEPQVNFDEYDEA